MSVTIEGCACISPDACLKAKACSRQTEQCPRVQQRIECPECWYPVSEAAFGLASNWPNIPPVPGDIQPEDDPGCFPPQYQLIKELEELAELLQ